MCSTIPKQHIRNNYLLQILIISKQYWIWAEQIVWKKESYWQNIYDTKLNCRNKYLNLLVLFSDNVYKWHQTISSDQRYRKKEYKGKKNKKKDKKTIATTTNKINKVKTFAMSNKVEK